MRAITGLMFNDKGTDFIRQGKKSCEVEIFFPNDQSIRWIKEGSTARYEYEVDGDVIPYTKLGGAVPDAILDALGVQEIEVEKTFSIRPQIHNQFDSPLLLTESSGRAARALAKLTKLDVILKAQQFSARDLRSRKQDLAAREREKTETEATIQTLPDPNRIDEILDGIGIAMEHLEGVAEVANDIVATIEDMEAAEAILDSLPPKIDTAHVLKAIDDAIEVAKVIDAWVHASAHHTQRAMALDIANEELEAATMALEAFEATLEFCPTCGRLLDEDHAD